MGVAPPLALSKGIGHTNPKERHRLQARTVLDTVTFDETSLSCALNRRLCA
jgi:hypothetical protein